MTTTGDSTTDDAHRRAPGASRIERYDPATDRAALAGAVGRARPAHDGPRRTTREPAFYLLTMYPYPSGDPPHRPLVHQDADRRDRAVTSGCTARTCSCRSGFDAFGLPAENAAIKNNINPRDWTMANIENMRRQLRIDGRRRSTGSAEVVTCDPEYYRWNQWFFLRFLEAGLAYRADVAGRLVPQRRHAGPRAGRGRGPPLLALRREGREARPRRSGTCGSRTTPTSCSTSPSIDWPDPIRIMQTNWIGRSEGAEIVFETAPVAAPRGRRGAARVHDAARTRCSGRRSWCSRRSIRWSRR